MNSHKVRITIWRSASPLAQGEGIEVRGSTTKIRSEKPQASLSQTHSFALTGAGASVSPSGREKGEVNVALIT